MAQLSTIEQQFLTAKQAEQAALMEKIAAAESRLAPLEEEYNAIQPQIDAAMAAQKANAEKRQAIIAETGLMALKNELGEVARDVTKLLQKQRR